MPKYKVKVKGQNGNWNVVFDGDADSIVIDNGETSTVISNSFEAGNGSFEISNGNFGE